MDVQAVDINISKTVQQLDVYFKKESTHSIANRTLSIGVGIPGNDVFASDSRNSWMVLLKSVEEKLRRQLEKR
jgi:ribosome-associated translation inhibitor RaiA